MAPRLDTPVHPCLHSSHQHNRKEPAMNDATHADDIDLDALYNEFINAARTATRQALDEEKEEREIQEAQETLLDILTHN
uniref:Uncharacterized protein n=1 Tax=Siphoviridae sp. ctyg07 TaxID=2825747 RepID=A0A8S5VCB5_9CAUD|nr:MAG TPA: hypothetical protein [Siphoviridae sp. ctyg07]